MMEHDDEPMPGLPGNLPQGEQILWQGRPDARVLARTALHTRLVGGYFAVLAAWSAITAINDGVSGLGDFTGVVLTIMAGTIAIALLRLLAWAMARTTIYTLTNRRVVMRFGVAVPKCINLPLGQMGEVNLALHGRGAGATGDMPLAMTGDRVIGYLGLWPHARPWHVVTPQPMLRAVPDAANVAAMIARAALAANPQGTVSPVNTQADRPASERGAAPVLAGAGAAA